MSEPRHTAAPRDTSAPPDGTAARSHTAPPGDPAAGPGLGDRQPVRLPIDPDVDLHIPAQRRETLREHGPGLAVISLGGGLGGLARYGLTQLLPTHPGQFPWGTFTENVLGCFAIGVLMVLITEVWSAHRLVRPFLGVGFLGGFTTFSTYAVEIRGLLQPGSVVLAFGYLAATLVCALLAVLAGVTLARVALLRKEIRGEAR